MHCTQTHWKHTRYTEGIFLKSGRVMKRRNIIPVIAPNCIIKIVDYWGKKSIREQYGKGIEIFNRNK